MSLISDIFLFLQIFISVCVFLVLSVERDGGVSASQTIVFVIYWKAYSRVELQSFKHCKDS